MIAIVDYGVGNLFSLRSSLAALGFEAQVTRDEAVLLAADKVVLPGVGAFGDAMDKLRETGMEPVVQQVAANGTPLLGICLGMQVLFEQSHEFGTHKGLGLIRGEICPMQPDLQAAGFGYKVPQIGWNPLHIVQPGCPLMQNVREGDAVYYVHSYYAKNCAQAVVATSEYGIDVVGVVQSGNVFGTQFHPEKSGRVGLAILRAFGEMKL